MSHTDAETFVKYAVVMEIARDMDTNAVAELAANELGLTFSADELEEATEALEAASQADAASPESGELDDDALEAIAGGFQRPASQHPPRTMADLDIDEMRAMAMRFPTVRIRWRRY